MINQGILSYVTDHLWQMYLQSLISLGQSDFNLFVNINDFYVASKIIEQY